MSSQRRTRALLLRRVAYGEADLVVTLLTEDDGRRSLFARGARKSRRRFAGALEPLRLIEVSYQPHQGDDRLARLDDARVVEGFDAITGDMHRFCWASLALEWTGSVTVEGEPTPVFDTAVELLRWLSEHQHGSWHTEVGCLRYALVLLDSAGMLPQLDRCVRTGQALDVIEKPAFSVLAGGLVDEQSARPEDLARPVGGETVAFLLEIARGRFPADRDPVVLRAARDLVLRTLAQLTESEPKALAMLRTVWV